MSAARRERLERRDRWQAGIREGRILAFGDDERFVMYPTLAMRDEALAEAQAAGYPVRVITSYPQEEGK